MQDLLKDIVAHTHNLGFLNIVKITGSDVQTLIDSMSDDRSVIMFGQTSLPQPDMIGVFGMAQLGKLKYHLDCPEYKENAKIEIVKETRNNEMIPTKIHFENQQNDFKNDYHFMNSQIINEKLKTIKFKGVNWHVEVTPSLQAVQRFQFQAATNNEHTTFVTKTDKGSLKFVFGDPSTHGGEFVFASGITGALKRSLSWPVQSILSILKIADVNNTKLNISDDGALMITLDSGLATYKYIIPAQA
jgi:hypothetical protein